MRQPKHTPGPWSVAEHMDDGNIKISSSEGAVAVASWGRSQRDTLKANARLISAAPELLEALEALRHVVNKHLVNNLDLDLSDAHTKALNAIIKATGGAE